MEIFIVASRQRGDRWRRFRRCSAPAADTQTNAPPPRACRQPHDDHDLVKALDELLGWPCAAASRERVNISRLLKSDPGNAEADAAFASLGLIKALRWTSTL
jgi:hypothetical protein